MDIESPSIYILMFSHPDREEKEESWKWILKGSLQAYIWHPNPRRRKGRILKMDIESLHTHPSFSTSLSRKKRKNPENGYWKSNLNIAISPNFNWRKGRILKMDIESMLDLSLNYLYTSEEKEESWKWILKVIVSPEKKTPSMVEEKEESWKWILKAHNTHL